jgi:hypothetical protein
LSMPTTENPRSSRYSDRCDPMNPAAPVTSALGILRTPTTDKTTTETQRHRDPEKDENNGLYDDS